MSAKFSEIVREHRRLSGLSQAALARMAGVGKTAVFDLEHGKESVQLDTLLKILTVLNIDIRLDSPVMKKVEASLAASQESLP